MGTVSWLDWYWPYSPSLAPATPNRYPRVSASPYTEGAPPMPDNVLYYGDNLDVLRRYIKADLGGIRVFTI